MAYLIWDTLAMNLHGATTRRMVLLLRSALFIFAPTLIGLCYSLMHMCRTLTQISQTTYLSFSSATGAWIIQAQGKGVFNLKTCGSQTLPVRKSLTKLDSLLMKIDTCAVALCKWNFETFGHVGWEIHKFEEKPKQDSDALTRRQTLKEIREWRQKEQILWWQRSHRDYLRYSDANTRWFHARVTTRKAKNYITGLYDSAGIWRTSTEEITNILPRPAAFKSITPRCASTGHYKVCDLINYTLGGWCQELIRSIFLPCDADLILNIPLCLSWPSDKLVWHYNSQELFTDRSQPETLSSGGCYGLAMSPCTSRSLAGSLPMAQHILTKILGFAMSCNVCGHAKETPTHAVLERPLALEVWKDIGLEEHL
ncbi:hypothetical protein Cgig2_015549 [Carnegiea gigantea]|uniref:Uncharacterized protein n=1 Tax=Carnegiea gigantea TaxID=171969 RepID=A0A9Q1GL63_9CARY|nr:hypothetical protein Cgig2_015549 [Carnegiea gigantea]